jgi:hypothetical protein
MIAPNDRESEIMLDTIYEKLTSYNDYLAEYPFHENLGIDLSSYGDPSRKQVKSAYHDVDPSEEEAFPAELDDLIRLHYLVTLRKVTTILEFGVGKSSAVFDHALQVNKVPFSDYISQNLRRSNMFECHSVDNNKQWIEECEKNATTENVTYHYSKCVVGTFNDRVCTYFDPLPNICPDLIYLDGPDQTSPKGDVRGISTNHLDRLPMAADILAFEHFLLPGTLIVVDGRTANARFLKSNFQRSWSHWHSVEFDQHLFELSEEPLGIYNRRQIDFCLGEDFYNRII